MNTPLELAWLSVLLAGHLLGDFVFQTRAMAEGKNDPTRRTRALLTHGIEHTVVLAACVLPFYFTWIGVALLMLNGAVHVLVDRAKIACERRWNDRCATWFLLDQLVHLAVLFTIALVWPVEETWAATRNEAWLEAFAKTALVVGAFAFNVHGAHAIVLIALRKHGLRSLPILRHGDEPLIDTPALGSLIGILERAILLMLVLVEAWAGAGLVLTAKSVARFKELEDREFSEYYLVGTLLSALLAIGSGVLVRLAL